SLLKPMWTEPKNRKVMHSLDGAFRQWLNTDPLTYTEPVDNIPSFKGFSFNLKKELSWYLRMNINTSRTDNKELQLEIPAFDPVVQIKAPPNTSQVVMQIMVAAMPMDNRGDVDCKQIQLTIPYVSGAVTEQNIQLPVFTSKG